MVSERRGRCSACPAPPRLPACAWRLHIGKSKEAAHGSCFTCSAFTTAACLQAWHPREEGAQQVGERPAWAPPTCQLARASKCQRGVRRQGYCTAMHTQHACDARPCGCSSLLQANPPLTSCRGGEETRAVERNWGCAHSRALLLEWKGAVAERSLYGRARGLQIGIQHVK